VHNLWISIGGLLIFVVDAALRNGGFLADFEDLDDRADDPWG
jgi:hypothetical protein